MLPLSQREFSHEKITNPEACRSFSEFRNRTLRRVLAEKTSAPVNLHALCPRPARFYPIGLQGGG
jgi:hypothetical protein